MNADPAVDAGDAIPVSRFRGGHALDGDHADAGAGGELVLEPQHRVRHRPLRRSPVGEDLQRAHGDGPDPTGDPAAADDRDRLPQGVDADATSEEEIDRLWRARREGAGIFQEEGAFLRKEQRKACEIRALLIDLDLGEVRVVGQIEGQAGRHTVFDLSADIAPALCLRVTAKLRSTPASAYGVAVRTRRAGTCTPVSVPACEIFLSENWRGTNDQKDSSFLRRDERKRLSPHVRCSARPYRN